jgi:hypothetical protein
LLFVFHGAQIAQCRVSAPRVVEALDIVEHIGLGTVSGAMNLQAVRSVLSDAKKLSIAAFSQTLQDRLKVSSSFSEAGPFVRAIAKAISSTSFITLPQLDSLIASLEGTKR